MNMYQVVGESTASYCQHFKEAVQRAWPNNSLVTKPGVEELVREAFHTSLSEQMMRWATRDHVTSPKRLNRLWS